jgi:predicted amidohydrolase
MAALRPFKLALAQILVESGAKARNLKRAAEAITKAASLGADIVLLPEALTTGWTDPSGRELADEIPDGESCKILSAAAVAEKIFVCAGLIERSKGREYNSAVLIDPAGNVLLRHRKIFELEIAHELYALGDSLAVAETALGRVGVMICADGFAPGQAITRSLGLMGADIILSPCAWAVPPEHDNVQEPYGQLWLDNYGPVAREYRIWIAAASNVGPIKKGPWAGRKCIGCSMVVGPSGEKIFQGTYGERTEELTCLMVTPESRPGRGTGREK